MSHPWYQTMRWRKAAKRFLSIHPLCVLCIKLDITKAATIVDHVKPHKGNYDLFWDETNWQCLCAQCHSRHKQIQEKNGLLPGCDIDGLSIDENHPWRKL